ncbi:MAG: S26 family signal peptidase [Bacteroidales bacterium]|jgi:signal peptidase I|nr:S26 family signal peptidase [Bacteroidales bacterium]
MKILSNRYFKFGLAATLYILWVIWLGNWWFLIGLGIIFDIYVTEKINWAFWKKRHEKNHILIEWLDALIFAVIAVTIINIFLFQNYRIPTGSMEKSLLIGDHLFVSKVAYGPRLPNTPIAFPFTQHTMPITGGKSWSNLIQRPYKRLRGLGQVKRYDPVVFNFPEGDTVVVENQAVSYYEIVRSHMRELKAYDLLTGTEPKSDDLYMSLARQEVKRRYTIIYRPVDRRDNYVKRCVGLPGDTIEIKDAVLWVNGVEAEIKPTRQFNYFVTTNGTRINPRAFERMEIYRSDQLMHSSTLYELPLTVDNLAILKGFSNVIEITPKVARAGEAEPVIFPHNEQYRWNQDNFGPLWIPARGVTVQLDSSNICLYERIIDVYEGNDLKIDDDVIYINGKPADSYTFAMGYYWLMGDNRHNSADSRYWGFVPEDHVVGTPRFIWLSINKEARGLKKIRFSRFFMKAR